MKIGFCFLAVDDIKNIEIWQSWFANASTDFEIFIHSKTKYNNYPNYSVFKNKLIRQYAKTEWGKLISAQMYLWQNAYNSGCDYVVLVGDKNLPINQFEFLEQELKNANGKSIFNYSNPWWGKNMYKYEIPKFKVMGAYQWIIVNREHMRMLFESHKIFSELRRTLKHPDDESYPATTINYYNQLTPEFIERKNLTYVDWSRKTKNNNHPYTFKIIDDYNYNLLNNRAKIYIFARKFDELSEDDKLKILKIQNERLFNIDYSWKNKSMEKLVTR